MIKRQFSIKMSTFARQFGRTHIREAIVIGLMGQLTGAYVRVSREIYYEMHKSSRVPVE